MVVLYIFLQSIAIILYYNQIHLDFSEQNNNKKESKRILRKL